MAIMRVTQSVTPQVNVHVTTIDVETGQVLHEQAMHNLVVTAGRNQLRDAIFGLSITAPSRFAIGTSGTSVSAGDTALGAEVWRDVFTTKTSSSAQVEIKYFLTSTTANGNTIREAGLFNAASGGTMYARVALTDEIVKTSLIAVLFVWTLTWSAA